MIGSLISFLTARAFIAQSSSFARNLGRRKTAQGLVGDCLGTQGKGVWFGSSRGATAIETC